MKNLRSRILFPLAAAGLAVSSSLAKTLQLSDDPLAGQAIGSGGQAGPREAVLTEADLRAALPGRALVRVDAGELERIASLHSSRGRLLTGPALAALVSAQSAHAEGLRGADPRKDTVIVVCAHGDSLRQKACLDSLAKDRRAGDSAISEPQSPRALREIEKDRDTVHIGPDGEDWDKRESSSEALDEFDEQRRRGYIGQLFVDMGRGDWDWDSDEWAVVLYVVIGVIVVGAFVIGGGKALYDLVVNKEESRVFKEAGIRFSYSGLSMYGDDGSALYRDAYLVGGRFALGLEKEVLSLGLAVEGGSINLTVRGLDIPDRALDFRGGYLVGGPMVRFGSYRPLAFSMEFLNGTSDHENIGWISKARMVLAFKTGQGLLLGGHLGAVFYDLKFSDGLIFRRGDLNRDLSMVLGLDAGWAF